MMDSRRARTLVRIRSIEDDIAKSEWAQKRRVTMDAENAFESFDESLRRSSHTAGAVPAETFLRRAAAISAGVSRRAQLIDAVETARSVEEEFRLVWQEARQRREGVERLRDKIEQAEQDAEIKANQDLVDDVTSARHNRPR